ncbi:hypothetical protein Tco_0990545 [Tanacetum coccineum]|uniref:Uncharacterized protein n=1 Tax=Tanacetum coccineum TaxID=301880 RepID=A0ABQ5EWU8_9ASTR
MAFIKKKVGNGEHYKFWDDIWLGDLALKAQYPRLYALELHKDISLPEKKRDSSLALSCRHPPRGGVEEEQYSHLLSRVDEARIRRIFLDGYGVLIFIPECSLVSAGTDTPYLP